MSKRTYSCVIVGLGGMKQNTIKTIQQIIKFGYDFYKIQN